MRGSLSRGIFRIGEKISPMGAPVALSGCVGSGLRADDFNEGRPDVLERQDPIHRT
jgi:hypothetical protein